MYRFLLSDPTFRALNIPISPEARKELEQKIRKKEPTEPVITWNGYILTGYEQDDLCLKYHRSPNIKEMLFPRRADAAAWLCRQQLKRSDLTWTGRAWLISRLYEAMRDIAKRKKAKDEFRYRQFSPSLKAAENLRPPQESVSALKQLGLEYHLHKETIRRYVQFGRKLDRLEEKIPGVRIRILTGGLTVMMAHMSALLKMPAEQLEKQANSSKTRQLIPTPDYYTPVPQNRKSTRKSSVKVEPAIKKMPAYDPDADVNGLRYTVSAWRSSIARTVLQADLTRTTPEGRNSLKQELRKLIFDSDNLCKILDIPQEDRPND